MRAGVEKITKSRWYALGGFRNSALFRKHNSRCWEYYIDHAHLEL